MLYEVITNPGNACCRQQVRHEFGGDRRAGEHFPVLSRIPVIRDDRRYPLGGGALQRIHEDEEFDQMVVHRGTGRLDDKDVRPPDILPDVSYNFV